MIQVFNDPIQTEEELRELIGESSVSVKNKVIPHLDGHCRDFISKSPFLLVSSSNREGECDVSPRGDAPGFVRVMDGDHLAIPERPGNRRADTMRNILENPNIGLIFIIPGLEETLRINGEACLFKDQQILESMAFRGKIPKLALGVKVKECYVHCAKAFKRSSLWDRSDWPRKEDLPYVPKMLADHIQLEGVTPEKVEKNLAEGYKTRLY